MAQQTGIVIARLVSQGRLSYSEKISTYWPEFAQGNKQDVTLQDLVSGREYTSEAPKGVQELIYNCLKRRCNILPAWVGWMSQCLLIT
jgi:hypothetical protein